jgi:hypothetical protein
MVCKSLKGFVRKNLKKNKNKKKLDLGLNHNRFGVYGSRTLKNSKKSIIQSYM